MSGTSDGRLGRTISQPCYPRRLWLDESWPCLANPRSIACDKMRRGGDLEKIIQSGEEKPHGP